MRGDEREALFFEITRNGESSMNIDYIEEYAWNEKVYHSLLEAKENGDIVAAGPLHFGTIVFVEKVINQDETYIRVGIKKLKKDNMH